MPVRAVSTNQNSGTTSVITIPGTAEVGDFVTLLAGIANSDITTDLTTNGWTSHGSSAETGSGGELVIWSKTVTLSDVGADVTLTTSATTRWATVAMVHRDVLGLDVSPVFSTNGDGTASPTAPSITTTSANVELCSIYGVNGYDTGDQVTYTFPAGQTEVTQVCSTSGSFRNSTIAIGTEILESAGASGTRSASIQTVVGTSNQIRQGTASLAYAVAASPAAEAATVQVRQGGSWVEKPLKARVGGSWV